MINAPCGSWVSPITAESIASGAIKFSDIQLSQDTLYWLERRPLEKGRTALMSWSESEGEKELLPEEYNVRSRVHEYGGGALLVDGDRIFFINNADQQIYQLKNGRVNQITQLSGCRFTDGVVSGSSLYYVMEEHSDQTVNSIVRIDLEDKTVYPLVSGNDFYSNPRISPNGEVLAYICWNHPNMPWDGTELWTLDLNTQQKCLIAGGAAESIADPSWSPTGQLHYISDRSGWWNIYVQGESRSLCPMQGEFSFPQWIFGESLYGFNRDVITCSRIVNGCSSCGIILPNGTFHSIDLPYSFVSYVAVQEDQMALIASSPEEASSIVLCDLKNHCQKIIKRSSTPCSTEFLSKPEAISFSANDGALVYAWYYPPKNPEFQPLHNEKPPLLVHVHGGPTAYDPPSLSNNALYWTSRGFAYVTVNYRGSSGYGRAYRDELKGNWGIVDIEDCMSAARYCVKEGLADPKRLAIEGGSAGGYTVLKALSAGDLFQVGADHFGVSDLELLVLDTHKFESHYLNALIGPYPDLKFLYRERSPIDHVDRINHPVIIFQGSEDPVVPPSQSSKIYENLIERDIPTAYLLFQGEQHGFRKAENIQRTLEAQLYFFSKILKFPLSESIKPVDIKNLKTQ